MFQTGDKAWSKTLKKNVIFSHVVYRVNGDSYIVIDVSDMNNKIWVYDLHHTDLEHGWR